MTTLQKYFSQLTIPEKYSHKGQNGKLLLIGGSDLFHAASKWSLDIASKCVDMVFYCSVPSNNELIQAAKGEFWNGIVVKREDVESYVEEADCILIGPGMERATPQLQDLNSQQLNERLSTPPSESDWNQQTEVVVNYLLKKYPQKKWVIDAGALQMVLPQLLQKTMIITPHTGELERLQHMIEHSQPNGDSFQHLLDLGVTVLLKGPTDYIYSGSEVTEITGGNPGMTKGGTGDVLAGLVAGLYCTNNKEVAAVVGSFVNKRAGEKLAETVGPFFNASDLVEMVPKVLWAEVSKATLE